jgi:hypothetical protein
LAGSRRLDPDLHEFILVKRKTKLKPGCLPLRRRQHANFGLCRDHRDRRYAIASNVA